MLEYKLKRPIKDMNDNNIDVIKIKDDEEVTASDIYSFKVEIDASGNPIGDLKIFRGVIANICGLTEMQVDTMHPSDYMYLVEIAGKYTGEL
jgi:hypothetical protein